MNLLDENTWRAKFNKNTIKTILAEHVWEHLTYEEGMIVAQICFTYLKPSGYIRCAVPDGYFAVKSYQHIIQVGGPVPSNHPAADHKIVHNYQTLKNMFETAGYNVNLLEYCNEQGNFQQNYWDGNEGVIFRSKKYDPRNKGEDLVFPSLIVDAVKPL